MPRLCSSWVWGFLAAAVLVASPAYAQNYQTTAPVAFLIDSDTGSVLYEKAADDPAVPASTAKLMTAEVVFHEIAEGRLKLEDEFTVSENAWRTGGALARGSSMFAALNSRISVENLIRGLVIDSGNDAAVVLAEGLAGSEGSFAGLMNRRAQALGLTHLTFRNAWGRDDPQQRVTAREMAMLARHVIQTYPTLYRYFGEKEFLWNKIRQTNRNPLITMGIGADGLKTGNIDEKSGYGIVGSAVQDGQRLIVVLYGMKSARDRADEARKLLEWGFRSFEAKTVFKAGETVGSAKVFGGDQGAVDLVAKAAIKVLVPRGSSEKLAGKIVYTGPVPAPVEAGSEIARLKIQRGTADILDVPLVAKDSVTPGSLPRRAADAGLELGIDLVRKYVFRK